MFDEHKNFAVSVITEAPSSISATSVKVLSGDVSLFPTPPFNATIYPSTGVPNINNSEIVRVVSIDGDTFTIERAQENTTIRDIQVSDYIANTITTKVITDLESYSESLSTQVQNLSSVFQPLNSNLTQFSSLSAFDNGIIQYKGSAWTSRTLGQFFTDLMADPTPGSYYYSTLPYTIENDKALLGRDSLLPPHTASEITIGAGLQIESKELSVTDELAQLAQLTSTSYGRDFLSLSNSSAAFSHLNLGTAALLNAGSVSGAATLDSSGKLVTSQIPDAILGQVKYQGTWNASTNTPTLSTNPLSSTQGYYYVVSVSGTFDERDFSVGDWIISNGTSWDKVDNTDQVTMVAGRIGAITLTQADIGGLTTSDSPNFANILASGGFKTNMYSASSIGVVGDGTAFRMYENAGVAYGVGTNANGGLDISANQDGQSIRLWAGSDNSSPTLAGTFNSTGFQGAVGVTTPSTGRFTFAGVNQAPSDTVPLVATGGPTNAAILTSNDDVAALRIAGATGSIRYYGYNSAYSGALMNALNADASTYIPLSIDASAVAFYVSGSPVGEITTTGINNTDIGVSTPKSGGFTAIDVVGSPAYYSAGGGAYLGGNAGSPWATLHAYSDDSGTPKALSINTFGGNVGIGTAAPTSKFVISDSGNNGIEFQPNTAAFGLSGANYITSYDRGVNGYRDLVLDTGQPSQPTLLLKSGGVVIVGSTTSTDTPSQGIQLRNVSNVGVLAVGHANGTAGGNYYASFAYDGSQIGSITQNGTSGVSYNTTSDLRLKTNIRDFTESASIIDAIRPRIFDWHAGDKDSIGFIAQELYEVYPAAVTKGDDNPEEITRRWAVDFSKLIPVLVREIQSLRHRVATLESTI